MVENKENSAFKLACIRANIEEFIKEKIVKKDTIKIAQSAQLELYHGTKYPIDNANTRLKSPSINLIDITFQTIFFDKWGDLLISFMVIEYRPKSARNANIDRKLYILL